MEILVMGPDTAHGQPNAMVSPIMDMTNDEMEKLAASILIVIPYREAEGVKFGMMTAAGVWARMSTRVGGVQDEFGGFIEMTRAGIARMFLDLCRERPSLQYLVMIDSDEVVAWDAPYLLARWGKPIVSGVVCNFAPSRGIYACFTVKDEYGIARFPSINFSKKIPARGLSEVISAGTGLMCIHKSVFEKFVQEEAIPFYIDEDERKACARSGVLKVGEDIAFCRKAKELGFPIYVDWSVHAEHYKVIGVKWPDAAIDYEMDPNEFQVSVRDYSHG